MWWTRSSQASSVVGSVGRGGSTCRATRSRVNTSTISSGVRPVQFDLGLPQDRVADLFVRIGPHPVSGVGDGPSSEVGHELDTGLAVGTIRTKGANSIRDERRHRPAPQADGPRTRAEAAYCAHHAKPFETPEARRALARRRPGWAARAALTPAVGGERSTTPRTRPRRARTRTEVLANVAHRRLRQRADQGQVSRPEISVTSPASVGTSVPLAS